MRDKRSAGENAAPSAGGVDSPDRNRMHRELNLKTFEWLVAVVMRRLAFTTSHTPAAS
jgi:hypothetical protein